MEGVLEELNKLSTSPLPIKKEVISIISNREKEVIEELIRTLPNPMSRAIVAMKLIDSLNAPIPTHEAHPIGRFLGECVEVDVSQSVPKWDLYSAYVEWDKRVHGTEECYYGSIGFFRIMSQKFNHITLDWYNGDPHYSCIRLKKEVQNGKAS